MFFVGLLPSSWTSMAKLDQVAFNVNNLTGVLASFWHQRQQWVFVCTPLCSDIMFALRVFFDRHIATELVKHDCTFRTLSRPEQIDRCVASAWLAYQRMVMRSCRRITQSSRLMLMFCNTGTLPPSWSDMAGLLILTLYDNKLTGACWRTLPHLHLEKS